MHRHGYRGRKLSRSAAQRRALLRGLSVSLIEYGSIETTLPKAKELVPFFEKIITKAKVGTLHSRRQVVSKLNDTFAANVLIDELVPKISKRTSGHLRIEKTKLRVGDGAQMALVSFVDDITVKEAKKQPEKKEEPKKAATTTKEDKK